MMPRRQRKAEYSHLRRWKTRRYRKRTGRRRESRRHNRAPQE